MRKITLYGAATALLVLALPAFADPGGAWCAPGQRVEHRIDRRGDRIDHRLDRRGARIDHRFDRRGRWAARHAGGFRR